MAGYDPDVVAGHRCPAPTISDVSTTDAFRSGGETIRALTRSCFLDDGPQRR